MRMPQISTQVRPSKSQSRLRKDAQWDNPDTDEGKRSGPNHPGFLSAADLMDMGTGRVKSLDDARRAFANGSRAKLDISL